jgi:hypothetical protein
MRQLHKKTCCKSLAGFAEPDFFFFGTSASTVLPYWALPVELEAFTEAGCLLMHSQKWGAFSFTEAGCLLMHSQKQGAFRSGVLPMHSQLDHL